MHSSKEIRDRGNATAARPTYRRERAATKHRNVRLAKRHLVNMNWFMARNRVSRFMNMLLPIEAGAVKSDNTFL